MTSNNDVVTIILIEGDEYEYIATQLLAPENAMGQYNRIADAILTLNSFPDRFALFELEPEYSWGMRRMVVDNYLVCYMIEDFSNICEIISAVWNK